LIKLEVARKNSSNQLHKKLGGGSRDIGHAPFHKF